MSRQLRRMAGGPSIPSVPEDSVDNYDPLGGKIEQITSQFDGLTVSSESEHEQKTNSDVEDDTESNACAIKRAKKNKKKRNNKHRKDQKSGALKSMDKEEDDIDRCLREIGEVQSTSATASQVNDIPKILNSDTEIREKLFKVKYVHLVPENELDRKFGRDPSSRPRDAGRRPNLRINKHKLLPSSSKFERKGISMDMTHRGNELVFNFTHTHEYQRKYREYLVSRKISTYLSDSSFPFEMVTKFMIVEGYVIAIDYLFYAEEYDNADEFIRHAIAYLEFVAHPNFDITNYQSRLEYIYIENRSFHVLLLRYAYMLSNRACHRTALEIVKILLNLDPSDPLGVALIIDGLALRAREHKWLIEAFEFLDRTKSVGYMLNMKFSYAMASFHVATKSKDLADMERANERIREALLAFPTMFFIIYRNALNMLGNEFNNSELFTTFAEEKTPQKLRDLMKFYVAFTKTQWCERSVTGWFTENAKFLAEKFKDQDTTIVEKAVHYNNTRIYLFRDYPNEIYRHLSIVEPMSKLVVDGAVPPVSETLLINPRPPDGSTNYSPYVDGGTRNHFREFFATLFPENIMYQD